jgi:predicted TIM-barrel fold metal-dependent hydrolase
MATGIGSEVEVPEAPWSRWRLASGEGAPIPPLIDVHHHVVPPLVKARLAGSGVTQVGGIAVPDWDEGRELGVLDRHQVAAAVVSLSDTGPAGTDGGLMRVLAREANQFYAELLARHPRRFGAFAVLPLPDVDAALAEVGYALDILGLDGVMLLSSYAGRYLGDPAFDPVLGELHRRSAVVFVHPATPATTTTPQLPTFLLDYVFETTRAVTNLLRRGILQRFPGIRLVLAHAGGTIPYLTERLALAQVPTRTRELTTRLAAASLANASVETVANAVIARTQRRINAALARLYYDTALSTAPPTFQALDALAGPGQVLFGSDYPYAPEPLIGRTAHAIAAHWDGDQLRQVANQTAAGLFPRLAPGAP